MQRHGPVATPGLQRAADRVRRGGLPVESDRHLLVFRALPDEFAGQMAVFPDITVDDRGALEWIEAKSLFTDRHEASCRRTAGIVCRDDGTDPATLQTVQGQDPTRLQGLAQILVASADNDRCQQHKDGGPTII